MRDSQATQDRAPTLTGPQRRFVEEYAHDGNGTRAYRVADPSARYAAARTGAARLRKLPPVAAEIQAGRTARRRRTRVSSDRLVRELAAVAFSDIGDLFDHDGHPLPTHRVDPLARLAVESLTVARTVIASGAVTETFRVKFWDKCKALDMLARHLGLGRPLPPLQAVLALVPETLRREVIVALAASNGLPSAEPSTYSFR